MRMTNTFAKSAVMLMAGALLLGGCAGQTTKMSDAEKAQQAVAKAEAAVEKTRTETGDWGTWKSTLGILGNARASLEQGDFKAAMDAANEARFQAEAGLDQYREEQSDWKKAVSAARSNGEFSEAAWVSGQE